PTVLLYCHYDVQPPGDLAEWHSPPFRLTERGGRWYGRGAADAKGNLVAHLTALRALGPDPPVGVRVLVEGSEESDSSALVDHVRAHPRDFAADAVLLGDSGNAEVGVPTATVVLRGAVDLTVTVELPDRRRRHGPDAPAALLRILNALRDGTGAPCLPGLPVDGNWSQEDWDEGEFRQAAGVLPGVALTGTGSVADRLWARPALTVTGIDGPPATGAGTARARINLRIPPGTEADSAAAALVARIRQSAPWGARVAVTVLNSARPYRASASGPVWAAFADAAREVYGQPLRYRGDGGTVPVCSALAEAHPGAEVIMVGVEEPLARVHAPDESVHPDELARTAATEALFCRRLAAGVPGVPTAPAG
ncbi:M20/M25/M40 family metallo-hydrolase, partial [Streptacidiphilus monticola]